MEDSKKKVISLSLDERIYKDFKDFCDRKGMKTSSRIAILMQKDIEFDRLAHISRPSRGKKRNVQPKKR